MITAGPGMGMAPAPQPGMGIAPAPQPPQQMMGGGMGSGMMMNMPPQPPFGAGYGGGFNSM